MKAMARLTGIVFILVGLAAVVLAASMISGSVQVQPQPAAPSIFGLPDFGTLLLPLRLMAGGFVGLQGLVLAALGQVLWLAASIVDHSQRTSEYLATIAARGSLTIP